MRVCAGQDADGGFQNATVETVTQGNQGTDGSVDDFRGGHPDRIISPDVLMNNGMPPPRLAPSGS